MVDIKLYFGDNSRQFYFYELLDGLMHLRELEFDYIVVDDDLVVKKFEFERYLRTVNDYCKKVCGYFYEL